MMLLGMAALGLSAPAPDDLFVPSADLARRAMLLGAMTELARRPPAPPRETTNVDGARHAMLGILVGKFTGGLTRYAFPAPRFDLVDGVFVDRTYAPPETGEVTNTPEIPT